MSKEQDYWVNETIALLTFSLIKGVGYWTVHNLVVKGLSLKQVLKANNLEEFVEFLKQAGCKTSNQFGDNWQKYIMDLWEQANHIYQTLKNQNIEIIHYGQEQFPQRLKQIDQAPRWLFVQGNISLLHQKSVAIVGTRKPSEDGKFLAKYIGSCLSYWKEAVTISGLAYGIDQNIHQESIRANVPTIAFIGTGILLDYPNNYNSQKLRQQILEKNGAIVSEYLPSESYSAQNFIRRNRLQSGLADIVIPIEWKLKSGTAHTVRYAQQNNRPIICLRLPDWSDLDHPELLMAQENGAKVMTIPGQESELIKSVQNVLNCLPDLPISEQPVAQLTSLKSQQNYRQLTLWDELR